MTDTSRESLIARLRKFQTEWPRQGIYKDAADMLEADTHPKQVTCQIYGHVVGACVECNTHIEAQQVAAPPTLTPPDGWAAVQGRQSDSKPSTS